MHNNQQFEWHHLGSGPLREALEQEAIALLPENVHYKFYGQLTNEEVYQFYHSTPVDLFLNVSETEGIPVSIMEAQSLSIPVVATAVGGTPEIVDDENGLLLPADLTPNILSSEISNLFSDSDILQRKRQKARENWEQKYNADINYQIFVKRILNQTNKTAQ